MANLMMEFSAYIIKKVRMPVEERFEVEYNLDDTETFYTPSEIIKQVFLRHGE
jgi:hypothetical protein